MGHVTLVIGGSVRVSARVIFLHPFHDIAVLKFDPEGLQELIGEIALNRSPGSKCVLRASP